MTEREQFEKVRSALEEYTQIPFMSSMGESLNQCCRTLASEGHADDCRGTEALKILEAWQAARAASPKVPEGMAIVPVERTFEAGARAFKNLMIEASHAAIHPHIEGVYGAFEHRLAATKEKGE